MLTACAEQCPGAADALNNHVNSWFEQQDVKLLSVLIDRDSGYSGNVEGHVYELYHVIEITTHTDTKVEGPQTNGICERFRAAQMIRRPEGRLSDPELD